MPAFIFVILLAAGSVLFHHSDTPAEQSSYSSYSPSYSSSRNHRTLDYDEALDEHWDEIKEYINGSETIEVYSQESGNYYTLDAELSNGEVESISFPNGGWIYINAELNSDGTGEGYGSDSYWDVEVDSYIIENAAEEWASDNGYSLSH
jgi:hypothetical protein